MPDSRQESSVRSSAPSAVPHTRDLAEAVAYDSGFVGAEEVLEQVAALGIDVDEPDEVERAKQEMLDPAPPAAESEPPAPSPHPSR